MLNHFICGSGAFHQDEEDDLWVPPPSSLRKSTRKFCSNKKSSNPYSTRGLDKFATVLLDLEKKRQMIYDQMNVQDISLVRFGYSSSKGGWVPIVVKYNRNQEQSKPNNIIGSKNEPAVVLQKLKPLEKTTTLMKLKSPVLSEEIKSLKTSSNEQKTKKIGLLSSSVDFVKWRCDYSWAIILALVLFCLVIYGRSFAIICTSIWWYLVPNMNAGGDLKNMRRLSMKKKDFNTTKRLSEKKMDFHKFSSFKTKNTKKTLKRLSSM